MINIKIIIRLLLFAAGIAGVALAALGLLMDHLKIGEPGVGSNQVLAFVVGSGVAATAYLLLVWLDGELGWRRVPRVLIAGTAFVGTVFVVADLQRRVSLVTPDPLIDLNARMAAVEQAAWYTRRRALGCDVTSDLVEPVRSERILTGLNKPVHVTSASDGSRRLFVVEKEGVVRIVRDRVLLDAPYLDIRDEVVSDGSEPPGHREQGLLSIAFHPRFASNGRFFAYFTGKSDGRTVVMEFEADPASDQADPERRRVVLEVPQPAALHQGGMLAFGHDGNLYIGMGDGGRYQLHFFGAPGSLLGKILRIDVDGDEPYAIPYDNPFIGAAGMRPEVYAFGLRNPWRFSFDRCDGSLFAGDVGSEHFEEVNLIFKGGNYGWPFMEGTRCRVKAWCQSHASVAPVAHYGHFATDPAGGVSVTGGHVYRGKRFPALTGRYLFADFVSTRLWSLIQSPAYPHHWQREEIVQLGVPVSSFGEDEDGEIYLLGYDGSLHMLVVGAAEG